METRVENNNLSQHSKGKMEKSVYNLLNSLPLVDSLEISHIYEPTAKKQIHPFEMTSDITL